ncbi:hypothetical protein PUR22_03640 [Mycolicibacterium porcinum]|uniref:ORC-CDC6 family AAA ATPase n=1 Tax=Mycolicibacterium porcinum TaxID=39693 RepID=UPI0031F7E6F7
MVTNPFEVTKAVDFTDEEIRRTFVEYPSRGYQLFAHPAEVMPKYLIGGKGGGRTHLLRWYSYLLQKQRREDGIAVLEQLRIERYLGVYFRCSGLNGSRFAGKRQPDDVWDVIFGYYLDVWLTEHLLNILSDIQSIDHCWTTAQQSAFASQSRALLTDDIGDSDAASPIDNLRFALTATRHSMDRNINNVALTGHLELDVLSSPGTLIFGVAAAAASQLSGLEQLRITFLIDEFENFSEPQQRYVNSLIREKQLPVGFLIGSRQWGLTFETNSGGETNKKGSEFETVVLEDAYRTNPGDYYDFCVSLALSRIRGAGYHKFDQESLVSCFGGPRQGDSEDGIALSVLGGHIGVQRPHLARLREQITRASGGNTKLADEVVRAIRNDARPLHEKAAILRFYQSWSSSKKISASSAEEARDFVASLETDTPADGAADFFKHRKADLLAQIFEENGQKIPYLGFNQFVNMSGFLPRSFLTTIKYVVSWAQFRGEDVFNARMPISAEAQGAGVLDAARWFMQDALPAGAKGEECDRAIRRLGSLLHRFRYSDKPTEVACSSFTTDMHGVVADAAQTIELCVEHNMLIEVRKGRAARNQGPRYRKFQIHPMLAPLYGLPTVRRGEINLNRDEVNSIFDPGVDVDAHNAVIKRRLLPLIAPFDVRITDQESLFDLN